MINAWLPVIATLSGAVVAGTISVLVSWLSNKNAMQHTRLMLSEDRARWAAEKRLDNLRQMFGAVERLLNATQQFRIQQAWSATEEKEGTKPPNWVLPDVAPAV